MDEFGKIEGEFTLEILKKAPFSNGILGLGTEGIRSIWQETKLRGCGYNRANEIVRFAGESVGLTYGTEVGKLAIKWFAEKIVELDGQLKEIGGALHRSAGRFHM